MEKSAYTQQSGSYNSLIKAVAKKRGNVLANFNFQNSPHETPNVYHLHNACLKFDAEREFICTTDVQFEPATSVFFGHKDSTGFFSQARILCNDTLIVENLDFIHELNILFQFIPMK
jgi:hypothetical protein